MTSASINRPVQPSPEPTQPDPTPDRPEATAAPTRSGKLVALLRVLIDYGRELAETLRQRNTADAMTVIMFGIADLPLILRRIQRGLLRAAALIARVEAVAARLDKHPVPLAGLPMCPSQSLSRPPPRAACPDPRLATTDPRLARLPAVEEIAADVASRPIGAVLADICRDLGILPSTQLWGDLHLAIVENGGGPVKLLKEMVDRLFRFMGLLQDPPTAAWPPDPVSAATTGPP